MFITEISRNIQVKDSYDVIIAGGGIAGISAALAARRQGKKVLLIEREFLLGGLATLGLITIYLPICDGKGRRVCHGISEELLQLSISEGAEMPLPEAWRKNFAGEATTQSERSIKRAECRYNASLFAMLAEKKLIEEGVEILYGTLVADVSVNKDKITHIIVENKSGRYALAAYSVVDATGDCDVARQANAQTVEFAQGNKLAAWYYRGTEGVANDLIQLGILDVSDGDRGEDKTDELPDTKQYSFSGLCGKELSEQVTIAHKNILQHFLAGGKLTDTHTINTVATIPQIRMTRRIVGEYEMDITEDFTYFDDSVGLFSHWYKRGSVFELPFRSLYSANIKNLICAGRNISVTDAMWDITRVIPVCAVSGEAAGVAASMTDDFKEISILDLQRKLKENGVKLHIDEIENLEM